MSEVTAVQTDEGYVVTIPATNPPTSSAVWAPWLESALDAAGNAVAALAGDESAAQAVSQAADVSAPEPVVEGPVVPAAEAGYELSEAEANAAGKLTPEQAEELGIDTSTPPEVVEAATERLEELRADAEVAQATADLAEKATANPDAASNAGPVIEQPTAEDLAGEEPAAGEVTGDPAIDAPALDPEVEEFIDSTVAHIDAVAADAGVSEGTPIDVTAALGGSAGGLSAAVGEEAAEVADETPADLVAAEPEAPYTEDVHEGDPSHGDTPADETPAA